MNIWEKLTDTQDNKKNTISEFVKRYEASILAWEKPSETIFIQFQYYNSDDDTFIFNTENLESTIIFPHDYSFINEKLYIPKIKKGFYYSNLENLNKPIAYIAHNPQRQWIRGIVEWNYTLVNFTQYLKFQEWLKLYFLKTIFTILKQQKAHYIIPHDVFEYCKQNNHVILNNDFLLTQNVNDVMGYSLFYHKYLVGTFIKPTSFKIENTLFLQEFLEAKETWNFDFSIIYP